MHDKTGDVIKRVKRCFSFHIDFNTIVCSLYSFPPSNRKVRRSVMRYEIQYMEVFAGACAIHLSLSKHSFQFLLLERGIEKAFISLRII